MFYAARSETSQPDRYAFDLWVIGKEIPDCFSILTAASLSIRGHRADISLTPRLRGRLRITPETASDLRFCLGSGGRI